MQPHYIDPAARLIELLSPALIPHMGDETPQPGTGLALRDKTGSFLLRLNENSGIKRLDRFESLRLLAMIVTLCDDAESQVRRLLHPDEPILLAPIVALRSILGRDFPNASLSKTLPGIQEVVKELKFVSASLRYVGTEPPLPANTLDSLKAEVEELISVIKVCNDIPKSLQVILFDLLDSLRRSIDAYPVKGIRGVRRTLFVTASELQENAREVAAYKDVPVVQKTITLWEKFDKTTASALNVTELMNKIVPLIPAIADAVGKVL